MKSCLAIVVKTLRTHFEFKILLYISWLASFLWVISGIIVIGSIYLSPSDFAINLIGGGILILAGSYFFLKEKLLLQLLKSSEEGKLCKRIIRYEIIFLGDVDKLDSQII